MKIAHKKIVVLIILTLLAFFYACTRDADENIKVTIDTYLDNILNKNLDWEYKQLNTSPAYYNAFRDSIIFDKAVKTKARKKILEDYYLFLEANNIHEKNPAFPLLSPNEYKEIETVSTENGFDLVRLRTFYSEINEFYEDIRLQNDTLLSKEIGWNVDCKLNLKDNRGNTQSVYFTFLLNPDKTQVITFEDKNDATMIEIHQVIEDAINENY